MRNVINSDTLRQRVCRLFFLLSLLPFVATEAQNVTISPRTGNLVAALTSGAEVGFENGWMSMWRHEQLPLTFSVADDGNLTGAGQLSNPAGNINSYNGNLVVMGGMNPDLYMALSLPKGYRITGYRLVVLNNLNDKKITNMQIASNNN